MEVVWPPVPAGTAPRPGRGPLLTARPGSLPAPRHACCPGPRRPPRPLDCPPCLFRPPTAASAVAQTSRGSQTLLAHRLWLKGAGRAWPTAQQAVPTGRTEPQPHAPSSRAGAPPCLAPSAPSSFPPPVPLCPPLPTAPPRPSPSTCGSQCPLFPPWSPPPPAPPSPYTPMTLFLSPSALVIPSAQPPLLGFQPVGFLSCVHPHLARAHTCLSRPSPQGL